MNLRRTVDGIERFDPVAVVLAAEEMGTFFTRGQITSCALGVAYRHYNKTSAATTFDAREWFVKQGMLDDYMYAFYRGFDNGSMIPYNDGLTTKPHFLTLERLT